MTWTSTLDYYRLLNEGVNRRLGGARSADLILRSFDFQPLLERVDEQPAVTDQFDQAAAELIGAGARVLAIASVTGHRFVARWEHRSDTRFVHVREATARALARHGAGRVGVIGTSTTMDDTSLLKSLTAGSEPVLPHPTRYRDIDEVIFGELSGGRLGESGQAALRRRPQCFLDSTRHRIDLHVDKLAIPPPVQPMVARGRAAARR
ncbi:aspartate/glutamate racemase family protein [Actinomycetes bacterium KLBMP 9759]